MQSFLHRLFAALLAVCITTFASAQTAPAKIGSNNRVSFVSGTIGVGQLEGLGFYLDRRIPVRITTEAASGQGIVAPHVYIQLVLIDLQTLQVAGIEKITASTTVPALGDSADPWPTLTSEQKVTYVERLIRREVATAAPRLFQ